MLRYHIETFLILFTMLAHCKFRLCQETEHWPRPMAVTVRQKCFYMVGPWGLEPPSAG